MSAPPILPAGGAVPRLLNLLATHPGRLVIGLAGLPGAGKSTNSAIWTQEVNAQAGREVMVAPGMDGFHLTLAQLRARPDAAAALARRGAPWTFDPAALAARLARVRGAMGREAVPWPGFEHAAGDPVEAAFTVAATARLVLVEGLYLLERGDGWDAVNAAFDEVWFLDTPLELALERLTLRHMRHMRAWSIGREPAAARVAANDRLNADRVMSGRMRADFRMET